MAPQSGPLRDRLRRTVAAHRRSACSACSSGQFATGGGWAPVVVIALISAIAALISAVNAALSLGVAAAARSTPRSPPAWSPRCPGRPRSAFFLAGAAWATLTTLIQVRTETLDPDRTAVAAVFTRIAELLAAVGTAAAERGPPGADHRPQRRLRPGHPQPQPHRRAGSRSCPSSPASSTPPRPWSRARWPPPGAGVPADPQDVAAVHALADALQSDRRADRGAAARRWTDGSPHQPRRPARRPARLERRRRSRGAGRRRGGPGRVRPRGPGCATWPTARWPARTAAPSPSAWRCA